MANYIYVVLVMCVENVVVFPIIGVIFHLNQHAGIYSKIHTNQYAVRTIVQIYCEEKKKEEERCLRVWMSQSSGLTVTEKLSKLWICDMMSSLVVLICSNRILISFT